MHTFISVALWIIAINFVRATGTIDSGQLDCSYFVYLDSENHSTTCVILEFTTDQLFLLPKFNRLLLHHFNVSRLSVELFRKNFPVKELTVQQSVVPTIYVIPSLESLEITSVATETIVIDTGYDYDLRNLNLTYSNITQLPTSVNRLSKLEILNFEGNALTEFDMTNLNGLNKLSYFNVQRNGIRHLSTKYAHLPGLKTLDLSYNRLTRVPVDLGRLKSLDHLLLAMNQIQFVRLQYFEGLLKLERLDLSGNKLRHIAGNPSTPLPNLQMLNLRASGLTYLNLSEWKLPRIKQLNVASNRLMTIENLLLASGGTVLKLDAQDNLWSCSWLERVSKLIQLVGQDGFRECGGYVEGICCFSDRDREVKILWTPTKRSK